MKNWLVVAALLVAYCTPGLAPAYAQATQCLTEKVIEDNTRGLYPGFTINRVIAYTGKEADLMAVAVDNLVPEEFNYDGLTSLVVNKVDLGDGANFPGIVFLKGECVLAMIRTDWDTYQKALALAFGPRA